MIFCSIEMFSTDCFLVVFGYLSYADLCRLCRSSKSIRGFVLQFIERAKTAYSSGEVMPFAGSTINYISNIATTKLEVDCFYIGLEMRIRSCASVKIHLKAENLNWYRKGGNEIGLESHNQLTYNDAVSMYGEENDAVLELIGHKFPDVRNICITFNIEQDSMEAEIGDVVEGSCLYIYTSSNEVKLMGMYLSVKN